MSIYIHIPFCNTICSYCDFCKMHYNESWANDYLKELEKEIKKNYKNELVSTIYIGGGTPSALLDYQIENLLKILNIFNVNNPEITFECNIENITKSKLEILKKYKVNRLSIGVQTFNPKLLEFLNRNHDEDMIINVIKDAKELGFNNISIDLIYGLKDQTLNDLEIDINKYLELDINHISTYSLIIEPNTKLYIDRVNNIDEDLDYDMYQLIKEKLKQNNFIHYETSNFAKERFESKHNLTYWNNNHYYGFGMGASGYIDNIRYDNTRSINQYLKGIYRKEEEILTKEQEMQYEMILGLRKIKGLNKKDFFNKYGLEIKEAFNIDKLLEDKKLEESEDYIFISEDYIYRANDILVEFV
jgi:oxygen-independent coproporphyrinogen III oxidase